ncbi:MAG: hypothetical protein ABI383_15680 [Acidobacteriaceae bacterium]
MASTQVIVGLALAGGIVLGSPASAQVDKTAPPPSAPAPKSAQSSAPATNPTDPHVFVIGNAPAVPGVAPQPPTPLTDVKLSDQKLSKENRLDLFRSLNAEIAYAKRPLPYTDKTLTLPANGHIEPADGMLNQMVMEFGAAAKKGDRVQITEMEIKDKSILFELNGGPKTKHKWYEHVSVGVGAAETAPMAKPDDPRAKGLLLTLTFPKYVPQISAVEVRELLSPILDFSVKSPTQAYADTLPPKIKAAVLDHKALVGMNHEMVLTAMGRPEKKFREDENGASYEDWMYGTPPATVRFLRFEGDRLIRIKEMPLGEAMIVRDKPEIDSSELGTVAQQQAEQKQETADRIQQAKADANRRPPTLQRPGDAPPVVDTGSSTPGTAPPLPNTTTPTTDPNARGTDSDASQYPQQQQQRRSGPIPGMPTSAPIPGAPGGDASAGPRY